MAALLECAVEPLNQDRDAADSIGLEYAARRLDIGGSTQDQVEAGDRGATAAKEGLHAFTYEGDRGAAELDARSSDVDNSAHSCR